jgi:hypothetical protein
MSASLSVTVGAARPRTRLHRRAIGAAVGLFAVGVPAAGVDAAPDDGIPFTSPTGDFAVMFPTEPQDVSDQLGVAAGAQDMAIFMAIDDGLVYLAGTFQLPFGGEPTASQLDEASDEFIQGLGGGELTYSAPIEFRGAPGLEVAAATNPEVFDGSVFGRMIFVESDVYMVFVMGERPALSLKDATVAAFLDSFDFVKAAF